MSKFRDIIDFLDKERRAPHRIRLIGEWIRLIGEMIAGWVGLIFAVIVLVWFVVVLFGSYFAASDQTLPTSDSATYEVMLKASALFGTNNIRVDRRSVNNVRLYIGRVDFENIPYPDREKVVEMIAKTWCSRVDTTYLPTVYIQDIRTGERLASYNCLWHVWVSTGKQSQR